MTAPAAAKDQARLTVDDLDQIVEGIQVFIIGSNVRLAAVWRPYLDKLATLRAELEARE